MRLYFSLAAASILAAPVFAQNALNESFNYSSTSVFPPTGWANVINAGSVTAGWEEPAIYSGTSGASTAVGMASADFAFHDDYGSGQYSDASLMTPTLDLSSYSTPELTYDDGVTFAGWMLHNGNTTAAGVSTIETSTDGGITWATVWTETTAASGFYPGTVVDLSSVGSQASVDIQFHYVGTFAHAWGVDNVVVDNGGNPTGPGLSVSGTCPGVQSANGSGMTAGGPVAFYYALAAGSTTIPTGGCAGLVLPVAAPTQLGGFIIADAAGNASLTGASQPNHCGLLILGAVDVATCTGSNTVAL